MGRLKLVAGASVLVLLLFGPIKPESSPEWTFLPKKRTISMHGSIDVAAQCLVRGDVRNIIKYDVNSTILHRYRSGGRSMGEQQGGTKQRGAGPPHYSQAACSCCWCVCDREEGGRSK